MIESNYVNFLSFYHADKEDSIYADSLVEGACNYIEDKMESGEWPYRKINYMRINAKKYSKFAWGGLTVFMGNTGDAAAHKNKSLNFQKHYDTKE